MPKKPVLNETALKSLGPKALVALVLEACDRDSELEKKVRMMLAAKEGGGALDAELGKRIKSLTTGRTFHDWRIAREYARTLDTVITSIVNDLGKSDPRAAVDRLWQLIDADAKIMERVDDSSGLVGDALKTAINALGPLIGEAGMCGSKALADRIHASAIDNGYGIKGGLVGAMAGHLNKATRSKLRQRFEHDFASLPPVSAGRDRDYAVSSRRFAASRRLMNIADADGEVDAYLAAAGSNPYALAQVEDATERLLGAGRATEALHWLERVPPDHGQWLDASGDGLVGLKLRTLDALDRKNEAQALRWQLFERHLWTHYLREHIRRLPDFEDDPVILKAIAHALAYPSALEALMFLVEWPDLDAAAKLVAARASEIDGRHYGLLNPAIDKLEAKHPAAATTLLRAKIDSVLARASSTQYGHAARDLARAAALAPASEAAGMVPSHAVYFEALSAKHARKPAFWARVNEMIGGRRG